LRHFASFADFAVTAHELNDSQKMKPLCAIRNLLSILAVVGLAIAMPVVIQPDIASDHAVGHAAMAMPEEAMPEDMPCCPKKAPIPDCGKDCLAMCATQFLCNAVQGVGLVMPHGPANVLPPRNDTALIGLGQRPPLIPILHQSELTI
jgi:hypothetical protein